MKILFDHQAFTMQNFGGISKCFCELVSHLPPDIVWEISAEQSDNIHLHEFNLISNLPYSKINLDKFFFHKKFRGKWRLYKTINKLFPTFPSMENLNKKHSIDMLKKGSFDVFHPTFFDDYFLPYLNGKPFVLTIHDMMPELFPQYFPKNHFQILMKRELVQKASAIVAVSEQTKKDIVRLLNVPEEKITVIYHGGPKTKNIVEKPIVNVPYFLYVGTRDLYKNFPVLLKDFARFVQSNPEVKLVCTGKDFSSVELSLIKSLDICDSVLHIWADDKSLENLYAHTIAFVYPSLYEGFGMPILEAYAYGCPVLLNHRSCFPEIAGEAAIYFNADENHSNLTEKLEAVYNLSLEKRNALIHLGKKRLADYSWEHAARQLADVYSSILQA